MPSTLQDKFEQGDTGSYIVTEQNDLVTLLHLHTKKDGRFLFEEVSIPTHLSKNLEWKTWLQEGAPGATSWILYEVDPQKKCITECYSLTRRAWIPTDEMKAFLIPLISLHLDFLSEEERLQKGPHCPSWNCQYTSLGTFSSQRGTESQKSRV